MTLLVTLAKEMDGESYDLKNAAANTARRAPLFSEKAEVQLTDGELAKLL